MKCSVRLRLIERRTARRPVRGLNFVGSRTFSPPFNASAIGALSKTANSRYGAEAVLIVRGVRAGEWKICDAALRKDGGPGLHPRIRNFSVDPEDLATDFLQASLVLMPSKAEGFGLVGLEAIAAGTPILISERSGLAELLVEHHLGEKVVVPTTGTTTVDVLEWQQAIDLVLVNRVAAFERAAHLRNRLASLCGWDDAVKKLVDALVGASTL